MSEPAVPRGGRWRSGLSALLAVPLLAWSAQAAAPSGGAAWPGCPVLAAWSGPFANIDASVDSCADSATAGARDSGDGQQADEEAIDAANEEADDVNDIDIDTDPPDALPLPLEPDTPPQVLAMRLDHALQRGHAVVLLLPAP